MQNEINRIMVLQMALTGWLEAEDAMPLFAYSGYQWPEVLDDSVEYCRSGGFISIRKNPPSITDEGKRYLGTYVDRNMPDPAFLVKKIREKLKRETNSEQAGMFADRFKALTEFLETHCSGLGIADRSSMLRLALFLRSKAILEQPPPLTSRIRGLTDFIFIRAAILSYSKNTGGFPEHIESGDIRWEKVCDGVYSCVVEKRIRRGPHRVSLLRMEPDKVLFRCLDLSRGKYSNKTLNAVAEETGAVAAITGGFFLYSEPDLEAPMKLGDPVGLLVSDGSVINPPLFGRSAFVAGSGNNVGIARLGMDSVSILFSGTSERIKPSSVNPDTLDENPAVFDILQGNRTPAANPERLGISITGRRVLEIGRGEMKIPVNGFVLSLPDKPRWRKFAASVDRTGAVDYGLPSIDGLDGAPRQAMAGGPQLLSGLSIANSLEEENLVPGTPPVTFCGDETQGRSLLPRMAVGITGRNEVIVAAVDGRNYRRSLGESLDGLSGLLRMLGCVSAVNMDGGSSKRMILQGKQLDLSTTDLVIDGPSTDQVRPIYSCILVLPKRV